MAFNKPINHEDVIKQAIWELEIELFEAQVEEEKKRLRKKKSFFPWRIKIINLNKEKRK